MLKKAFAILLFLTLVLFALDEEGKSAYNYAVKAGIARMSKGLTANQRRFYKIYLDTNEYRQRDDYTRQGIFEMYYVPIGKEVEFLYDAVSQHSDKMKEKADFFSQQNNTAMEDKMNALSLAFKDMADAISKMNNAVKNKKVSQANAAIEEYIASEGMILKCGAKPPTRNWLTVEESRFIQFKLQQRKAGNKK